jgi:hypothetical protein
MYSILFIGPLLLIAVLWWLLERHERRRAGEGKPRHSGLRIFGAAVAILAALFTGGCSLFFLGSMDGAYVNLTTVAVVGGPPFLAAALWSVVTMNRSSGTGIKMLALVAVFVTATCVMLFAGLTGMMPVSPETGGIAVALAVAAVCTGAAALWLFMERKGANPPES